MNMQKTFSLRELDDVIQEVLPAIRQARVVALYGGLGAGKTTFVRALARALGVQQMVTSPTFNYVHRYQASDGTLVYHFDLYRFKNAEAWHDVGFDEYLADTHSLVVIEWPEVIESLLPSNVLKLELAYDGVHASRRIMHIRS